MLSTQRSRYNNIRVVGIVLAIMFAVSPALASAADWRGRAIAQTNYGSGATIGTTNPNVGASASYEFIMSRVNAPENKFIQTGWIKHVSCGSNPRVFVENYTGSGGYSNQCLMQYAPSGDNAYYQEYDAYTGYWCHGYNGMCVQSKSSSVIGFTTSSMVAAYGETHDRVAQMGGVSQALAIWISNVSYKPTAIASQWNYIKSTGSEYGTCTPAVCPYDYGYGTAATVFFTFNWTK